MSIAATTFDDLRLPVTFSDGRKGEIILTEPVLEALTERIAKFKKPLAGYEALREALAGVGIHKKVCTLRKWKVKGRLPHRKFQRGLVFYLDEVLARIGGRS